MSFVNFDFNVSLILKIGFAGGAIAFWLWTQRLLKSRKSPASDQIGDLLLARTQTLNIYLNNSPRLARALLITSSLIVDALGIFLLARGILGESIQPLLGLVILFLLRQMNQAVTSLPCPPGMIWRSPGFWSLFVTYDVSQDLFFSGHTALAVFGAVELIHLGNPGLSFLAYFAIVYEIAVILALRAHWTMDVFTGAITALWVSEFVTRISPTMDLWLNNF